MRKWVSAGRTADSSPQATAEAYVEALDAADRDAANELIATEGPLDPWSATEFDWADAFDINVVEVKAPERSITSDSKISLVAGELDMSIVAFETLEEGDNDAIGDITISLGGSTSTVRYRFRKVGGEWLIWDALDGLRVNTTVHPTPRSAARSYIKTLDAGDRYGVNAVIADAGELEPWSVDEFDWVHAFDFEFVGFETLEEGPGDVIGDVTVTIGDNTETVRYRFRKTKNEWMLWEASESGFR